MRRMRWPTRYANSPGMRSASIATMWWVHAPRLVDRALAERLAGKAAELHRSSGAVSVAAVASAFGQNRSLARADPDFAAPVFSGAMARNASRLLPGEPPVRLQIDNLLVKEPVGGRHAETQFHQDFPWMPMDRSSM